MCVCVCVCMCASVFTKAFINFPPSFSTRKIHQLFKHFRRHLNAAHRAFLLSLELKQKSNLTFAPESLALCHNGNHHTLPLRARTPRRINFLPSFEPPAPLFISNVPNTLIVLPSFFSSASLRRKRGPTGGGEETAKLLKPERNYI